MKPPARAPERDYSHRGVVDKLGIKPGATVRFDESAGPLDRALKADVLDRAARPPETPDEPADVVLVTADATTDAVAMLERWRGGITQSGGIWLLTPKRGQSGYVDQRELIDAGKIAGLVDNKVCSVSDATSAMRFVIRRADRR